jgi:RND family efflux transporter MFP subunit
MRCKSRLIPILATALVMYCAALPARALGGDAGQAALPPAGVAVETFVAAPMPMTDSIDVVGTLAAKRQADVRSEYAGIVSEIFVSEWVAVKKGDRLARLDVREPQVVLSRAGAAVEMAHADQLQAKAALARAGRELARLEHLKTSGLATRQSLDEAATERDVALAKTEAAAAQLRSAQYELELARTRFAKTLISAPIDGVIAQRGVNVGDLVGEAGSNRVLFRIVDNRLLDLKVTVPARHVGDLRTELPLTFATASFPQRTFEGRVTYINPSLGQADRSLQVVAEVANDPVVLRDGMFVEGRIVVRERPAILQVPRGAMISWDMSAGRGELYVVQEGIARRRAVQTGAVRQDRIEIVSGLTAGERVIGGGGFNVHDGTPVTARDIP